ncbi:hypothetical protein HYDPIDRAFT_113972 [Hydnomerulius pinastri MD-312]|uniref:Uncharacterized protein n=1 Tax=Hydnomerulius pinastri MD-312 TaxID=994086 RepID=A0A0C9WDY1_9AGAM|nr:hypothetical protein HYDPIDRAFT_113972 [Hydnomerulius pinastri MD-312]
MALALIVRYLIPSASGSRWMFSQCPSDPQSAGLWSFQYFQDDDQGLKNNPSISKADQANAKVIAEAAALPSTALTSSH